MSNKHTNHKHGLHSIKEMEPKSKMYKRRNKVTARVRKAKVLESVRSKKEALEKQLGL